MLLVTSPGRPCFSDAPPVGYGRVRRHPRLGCSVHLCGLSWRGWPSRPLAWCLLLRLLSLLIGRLGRIACLSSVSTGRLRRKLSSVTLGLRFRTCRVFALLPQHAPSSAWRTGLPQAGVSPVTVCRRRPCRKTGPPPSLADGKGPRHQLLPAASCSPLWTHPARPCSGRSRARQPLFDHRAYVPRPVLSFPLVPRPPSQGPVLRSRGCPLERAAARVCREAGARVTCNTRLANMNLQVDRVDDRRLEPLHAAAKSGHTRSCSARSAAAWLSWPSRSGAGGVTRQPPLCAPSREPRRERCRFVSGPAWSLCLLPAGPHSCPTQPLPPSPSGRGHSAMPTVRSRPWVSFLQMQVRRPSLLAGCLPASCTLHSRWPPGYKWLVCLPCPAAPLKQGFLGDKPRRWRKGARRSPHPVSSACWRACVFQLRCPFPVPVSQLFVALEALQAVAVHDGRQLPSAGASLVPSLRAAAAALPAHVLLHFPWVLERCFVAGQRRGRLAEWRLLSRANAGSSELTGRQGASVDETRAGSPPAFVRGPVRHALSLALQAIFD